MKRIARLIAFWLVFLSGLHVVLTLLGFTTLWRSMSPSIAGPALQAMAVLLLVIGTQLLTQPTGLDRGWYLSFAVTAMAIGLLLASTRDYSMAPVSRKGWILIGTPMLCVAVFASFATSALGSRLGTRARVILAIVLLVLAFFIPGTLVHTFSVGE